MGQKRLKKVLTAEGETLIRLGLVGLLIEEGSEVVGQTAGGEEAVRLAREPEPDPIIMDMKTLDMDGITTAEIIGEEHITPVLMPTAFGQDGLVEWAHDTGVMGYLVKPLEVSEMVPTIEMAIGRFAELWVIEEELADLEDRLESRETIDQAKGMLQEGLGLTESEAFRWTQKTTMNLRKPMREVAEGIISHKRKK